MGPGKVLIFIPQIGLYVSVDVGIGIGIED
jgi:hypothetical protein